MEKVPFLVFGQTRHLRVELGWCETCKSMAYQVKITQKLFKGTEYRMSPEREVVPVCLKCMQVSGVLPAELSPLSEQLKMVEPELPVAIDMAGV